MDENYRQTRSVKLRPNWTSQIKTEIIHSQTDAFHFFLMMLQFPIIWIHFNLASCGQLKHLDIHFYNRNDFKRAICWFCFIEI